MKVKFVHLLAVTVACASMSLAACQGSGQQAQDNSASPSAQAQTTEQSDNATPANGDSNHARQGDFLPASLNLTDDQKAKIKEINKNYRSKMDTILNEKQKSDLKAAREQGKGREAMQSLNLSDTQKQQMKDLRKSQRQEIDNVLTADQKQQLKQLHDSRKNAQPQ